MTKDKKDKIVGGIIVAILFGIPLAIFLGPIAVIVFIVTLVTGLLKKKKTTPPKRVLPTINSKV
jgi:sorbitol-specific phosphotransferase system component IIBC